jgi:hypothetical protein
MWASTQWDRVELYHEAAASFPTRPEVPSVILSVVQQAGIMAGSGITAINGLSADVQTFATGTNGTDFNISSASSTHTFNLPTASALNRGLLSTTDWNTFNSKVSAATTLTINGVTYDLSANRSWTVSGGISGSGASGQVAYWTGTSAQTGSADFTWDGNNINLASAKGIVLQRTGSNRNINIISTNIADNFAGATFYPSSGTNVSTAFSVVPKGAGLLTTVKTAIDLFFTDYIANTTNWELGTIRTSSTAFIVTTAKGGTGVNRPILLASGYGTDNATNANQLWLYSNGNVGINTSTNGSERLQVQGTTLLNGNVTFSSSTGMFWDAANSRLGIGTNAPAFDFDLQKTVNNVLYARVKNLSNGTSAFAGFVVGNDVGNVAFQVVGSGNTLPNVTPNQARLRTDIAISNGFNFATGTTAPIIFSPNDTERMRIFGSTGNVGINTGSSDSGERLQVTGDVRIVGSGATSATTALTVRNSSGANILRVRNDGFYLFGDSGSRPLFATVSAISTPNLNGTALQFSIDNASGRTTTGFDFLFSYGTRDYTSGNVDVHRETANYTPTSGTGTFNMLVLLNTINQTGGANGITRGLYVNPTLTSAADFRAIETTNGKVIFGNLPTSSAGLPTGAIWNDAGTIKIV